uniref:Uncharacterized protein n=1 Tax=Physcomitrium patens TaxID=3218 RepID=A0A2K1KFA1_PHYPA|nr:hypothetical protein PHYPA_008830 [Physcomitrium patens]
MAFSSAQWPTPGSVTNVAPWVVTGVVTVGANTINREFPSYATTKDDEVFFGQISTNENPPYKYFPLLAGADVGLPEIGMLRPPLWIISTAVSIEHFSKDIVRLPAPASDPFLAFLELLLCAFVETNRSASAANVAACDILELDILELDIR